MNMKNFVLVILLFNLSYLANADTDEIHQPNITHHEPITNGLRIRWDPPSVPPTVTSTLSHFLVRWKNETDEDYVFSKEIQKPLSSSSNYYGLDLIYTKDSIKPCSAYELMVVAVYDDRRFTTSKSRVVQLPKFKGPFVTKVKCNPTPNSTIEVDIRLDEVFLSSCHISTPSYFVKVKGFSKWNNVREILPEFETSKSSFVLTGLYPYSLYNIEIREKRALHVEKTSVVTKPDIPGPVSDVKVECTSKRSISVGWSPATEANGELLCYWIEVVDLYKLHRELHKVETEFTKANLQQIFSNTEYHFVIWAQNEAGNGTTSDTVPVTISC